MEFSKHHHFRKRHFHHQPNHHQPIRHDEVNDLVHPEHTGSESSYLKSLVDSRAPVTVVLTTGEKLHGRIRYYDRHCFSIGLSSKGPRLFIRKENVSYIAEESVNATDGVNDRSEPRA